MRQKAVIGALLLIGVGVVLGATVFRTDIAQATGLAQSVTVSNTAAQAVPVREQNLDGNGNIKVHEQETANVNVTNSSLSVAEPPVTGGGQSFFLDGGTFTPQILADTITASAISIRFEGGAHDLILMMGPEKIVARFPGFTTGNDSVDLAFTRPVSFDRVTCGGSGGRCLLGWVGNQP